MAEQSGQEKTEAPTSKRLEDARKKGQVTRSRELNTLTSLLGAAIGLLVFGAPILSMLRELLGAGLGFDYATVFARGDLGYVLGEAVFAALYALLPLLLLLTVLALLSPVALGGWAFSMDLLLPKFERIDPLKGLGRMFSSRSLMELGKALAKFFLVGIVIVLALMLVLDEIAALTEYELPIAIAKSGELLLWCFLVFSAALLLVVAVDVPYQIWSQRQQLMMSKQEVRDESKESEGRPEVKMAIRQKQMEIAQRRMMEDVKKADVIITNPTHYAVALRYDQSVAGAPIVVAKGKDLVAARIRELGAEHKIAIFAAPPLARALYFTTDINQEVPEKLFVAVAQVLAYIYQLRAAQAQHSTPPTPPAVLPVPAEFDKEIP